MIRPLLLFAAALLSGCVATGSPRNAVEQIAVQRMRFAAEAVCLNNTSRSAQNRAARSLGFPIVERDGRATIYFNPGTLTTMRIGAQVEQSINIDGRRVVYRGSGCSVGSPAVGIEAANRIAGEILAPRLVDGSRLTATPVGAGVNEVGSAGFFFRGLSVTQELVQTTLTDEETGRQQALVYPAILIIHATGR